MRRVVPMAISVLIVLSGCVRTLPDKTTLRIVLGDHFPEEINLVLGDLDTLLEVKTSVHVAYVPVDMTDIGALQFYGVYPFISDGSTLTIDFTAPEPSFKSSSGDSPTERFQNALKAIDDKEVELFGTSPPNEEQRSKSLSKYVDFVLGLVEEERNSPASMYLLYQNSSMVDHVRMLEILNKLSPEIQATPLMQQLRSVSEARSATDEGKSYVDFACRTFNGTQVALSDYVGKGEYILLVFWASWCFPCAKETSGLLRIYNKFHGKNFDMLSLAVWEDDQQAPVDTVLARGIRWNQAIAVDTVPTDLYGVKGIPHTILFAPNGTILKRDLGIKELEKELSGLLGK